MDLKSFASAVSQLSQEKGLPAERIIEGIETALAAAYKKEYGEKSQVIKSKLDPKTGHVDFWQVKTVVDEGMIFSDEELEQMKEKSGQQEAAPKAEGEEERIEKVKFNPEKHIMLEDAKKDHPDINPGEEIKIELEEKQDFGRIAAQTAKQVIIQKIREAEKETVFADFKDKEGEIISGIIQRVENRTAFMDIGKTIGILSREEQVPGEFYRPGQRLKAFVIKVEQTSRGPAIFLSRAYPKFVSKLFELEVPEIGAGQIEVKSIAREAGSRTKIAVVSLEEGIDPIGAAVGQRGTRVSAVINELGGEKIDIIEYSENPQEYIVNSLSPAKIMEVKILPKNRALAVVPDDQLSLAIGKDGQNVRLAAKLTGWKIDVRSPENIEEYLAENDIKEQEESSDKDKKVAEVADEISGGQEDKKDKTKKSKKTDGKAGKEANDENGLEDAVNEEDKKTKKTAKKEKTEEGGGDEKTKKTKKATTKTKKETTKKTKKTESEKNEEK